MWQTLISNYISFFHKFKFNKKILQSQETFPELFNGNLFGVSSKLATAILTIVTAVSKPVTEFPIESN